MLFPFVDSHTPAAHFHTNIRPYLLEEAHAGHSHLWLFRDAGNLEQEERGNRVCFRFFRQCETRSNHSFIRLLEKFKLFSAFYVLTELRGREDLVTAIIENLDYSMCVVFIQSCFGKRWSLTL